MKELEKQSKERGALDSERIEEITERVVGRVKETKRNQKTGHVSVKAKEEIGQEVRRLKRIIEGKEKKERKNRIVIRGLNGNTRLGNIKDEARTFLEREFGVKEKL